MVVVKFTGIPNNQEINEFLENFGYTQNIRVNWNEYPSDMIENQFATAYRNLFIAPETTQYNYRTRENVTIPAQNTSDFPTYSINNLWSIWADIQSKPADKVKMYLVDNKLLFFWVPRTGRNYTLSATSRGWRGGEFSASGGSWFCMHRSITPDEEGNYPLVFGLPVNYTAISLFQHNSDISPIDFTQMAAGGDSPVPMVPLPSARPFKGIAYNWDFQGGIVYTNASSNLPTGGESTGDAVLLSNRNTVRDNIDWYGTMEARNTNTSRGNQIKFKYPNVLTGSTRARSSAVQKQRLNTLNPQLKRIGEYVSGNSTFVGREFKANCATEKSLKYLMENFIEQEEPAYVAYTVPQIGYSAVQQYTVFMPFDEEGSFSDAWTDLGWNQSLATDSISNSTRNNRQTMNGTTPTAILTKVQFDPESCGPIFTGNTPNAWKLQKSGGQIINVNHIINYNYRVPNIIR